MLYGIVSMLYEEMLLHFHRHLIYISVLPARDNKSNCYIASIIITGYIKC